jgi:hypothetical protein
VGALDLGDRSPGALGHRTDDIGTGRLVGAAQTTAPSFAP